MLKGKNIIVIGATGGIGRVLVRVFAEAGANLTLSARTESNLMSLAEKFDPNQILIVTADASKISDVENVFAMSKKMFGHIDALVIVAGTWKQLTIDEEPSVAHDLANGHFQSLFLPSFVAGYIGQRFFREQGSGLIVNFSSHAALRPELSGNLTYGPMKSASHHFMLALRNELRGTKVRVTDIAPAIVNTDEATGLLDSEVKRDQAVQPEEIAKWIIENLDNPNIPSTKLFDSTLIL